VSTVIGAVYGNVEKKRRERGGEWKGINVRGYG